MTAPDPTPRYVQRPVGLYRTVLDRATFERLAATPPRSTVAPLPAGPPFLHRDAMESRLAPGPLALHVGNVLRRRLDAIATEPVRLPPDEAGLKGAARDRAIEARRIARQVALADAMLAAVRDDVTAAATDGGDEGAMCTIDSTWSPLLGPLSSQELIAVSEDGQPPTRPETPIDQHWLLAAGPADPSLQSQLAAELATADRLDIICSFIKFSGVRLLLEELEAFCRRTGAAKPRLRVLTTTYMGATDVRAVVALARLPECEVRVSFDGSRTRLHAKAYIFGRETGFGSAYVGSANLSRAALTEGHEWVVKLAQASAGDLWGRIDATFESFWNSRAFEPFDPDDEDAVARLRDALDRESPEAARAAASSPFVSAAFELRPYPFQQEVLERLAAEREVLDRRRHLVVAATGTGKTMIAAFDYRAVCKQADAAGRPRPRLLFVAHQQQILEQALATFRQVLRDFNFGALLVGGHDGTGSEHLFASIQSIVSSGRIADGRLSPFEHVVVDEAHHGEADSYRQLLQAVDPRILLGLTATPERADGRDIFQHFGDRPSAEIRLPDAIERRLLSPFQYFVISDTSVDLTDVTFRRGTFDRAELERRFIGNEIRAALVHEKVCETCTAPETVRALGFCAGVAHAEFMADRFRSYGVAAIAVTGSTPKDEVRAAVQRLRRGEIRVIFTADLFNEGVDIPEVDTVLLLRPTESLTVFLQQLGRGLRLAEGKECLTVLDFVSQVSRQYRFEDRFRALLSRTGASLEREIERSFPSVPAGCAIRMERVAREVILANVRQHQGGGIARLVADLQWLRDDLGRTPGLGEYLEHWGRTPDDVYRRCTWTELRHRAGVGPASSDEDAVSARTADAASKGLRRLAHLDDAARIDGVAAMLDDLDANVADPMGEPGTDRHRLRTMIHRSLWPRTWRPTDAEAIERLRRQPQLRAELRSLLAYRREHVQTTNPHLGIQGPCSLRVHGHYTRDELMLGLGLGSLAAPIESREGKYHDHANRRYLMFVTLTKTEERFSPTTMYHDYAISEDLFHWQSQSTTSEQSPTGRMLVKHREQGVQLLLFVRDLAEVNGLKMPFMFLGPVETVQHSGSRPMNLTFRMLAPMPAGLYRYARRA